MATPRRTPSKATTSNIKMNAQHHGLPHSVTLPRQIGAKKHGGLKNTQSLSHKPTFEKETVSTHDNETVLNNPMTMDSQMRGYANFEKNGTRYGDRNSGIVFEENLEVGMVEKDVSFEEMTSPFFKDLKVGGQNISTPLKDCKSINKEAAVLQNTILATLKGTAQKRGMSPPNCPPPLKQKRTDLNMTHPAIAQMIREAKLKATKNIPPQTLALMTENAPQRQQILSTEEAIETVGRPESTEIIDLLPDQLVFTFGFRSTER